MADQDVQVVRVDAGLLHGRIEEVLGVPGDELVQRGRVRHQHRHRGPAAAAGAARLLPGGGDAARVAEEHGGVEAADVDAQLEGIGGHDAEHGAVAQAALDLPPLQGQVAAAVAADHALRPRPRLQRVLEVGDEHLRGQARGREGDRLQALLQEGQGHVARAAQGGAPDAELAVHHRRVVDGEVPLAPRRAAAVDERHLAAGEGLRQLPGVPDGGRRAQDLRPRAVELAQAVQAPEDVGHVRSVDAAVRVQLVHDHVAQVLEELHPLGVVGQDALVEHVRVGDHDVGLRADGLARVLGRVAVVGERPDVRAEGLDEAVELGELVLGQGLGGEEVEGAGARVLQDRVEDGQVVAQGLPGRGGGDDDGVAPGAHGVEGLALMRVGAVHAPQAHDVRQAGIEVLREIGVAGLLGREAAEGRQHGLRPQRPLDLERLQHGEERALGVLSPQRQRLAHVLPPTGVEPPTATAQAVWGSSVRRGTGGVRAAQPAASR